MKIIETKLKTSELMNELRKVTGVYSYWNDEELDKEFPVPTDITTREFSDLLEPDVLGKSHTEFTEEYGDRMMTMREYIIEQTRRVKNKKRVLDEINVTLFRDFLPGGKVACGYWHPDYREVRFFWDGAGGVSARCGARLCVKTPPPVIELNYEEDKNKQGFCITCKQCGFQRSI